MLSPNFYLLIGAIESAHAFILRCQKQNQNPPLAGPATKHDHLDPKPGLLNHAHSKLLGVKVALLTAEGDLSLALFAAQSMGAQAAEARVTAWSNFRLAVTEQSFVFATVVRRLMWNQAALTGAPEWEMMDRRLRRILEAFAEVGHGGGEDNPAVDGPGILGSSDESISY